VGKANNPTSFIVMDWLFFSKNQYHRHDVYFQVAVQTDLA